jgi:hypothetical protein
VTRRLFLPTTTVSMPSRRRAAVEDIEDAPASAQATQDSVRDDSDSEPGPSRKTKAAPAPEDDADSEIDVASFGNQSLARAHAQNVRALGADWAQLAQLARTAAGDALPEIGAALAEAGAPARAAIGELEGMMRELVDLDGAMRAHQAVLDEMYQRVLRDEDVVRVCARAPLLRCLRLARAERHKGEVEGRGEEGARRVQGEDGAPEVREERRVQNLP